MAEVDRTAQALSTVNLAGSKSEGSQALPMPTGRHSQQQPGGCRVPHKCLKGKVGALCDFHMVVSQAPSSI
jgi:hypothetical protein